MIFDRIELLLIRECDSNLSIPLCESDAQEEYDEIKRKHQKQMLEFNKKRENILHQIAAARHLFNSDTREDRRKIEENIKNLYGALKELDNQAHESIADTKKQFEKLREKYRR